MTSVSWNVLAVDKKNKPVGAVKCSVACCHQSKLEKQNKIPHRRTHFIQGCRNQLIFKAYQAGSLFSHENEIRGCTLTSHHSISGKRNPNNTASTGIANTQQSALQRGLQATPAIREQGSENMINESRDAEKHTNEMLRRSAAPV